MEGYLGDVRRISVLRANSIGDFICTMPALDALRVAYPNAEIVLLGLEWHRRFLTDRPGPVDRVVVLPTVGRKGANRCDLRLSSPILAPLRAEGFDLALQLHGGGRDSNPFVQQLGARLTAGSRASDAIPLDRWIPYRLLQPEIARFLDVVALVGARPTTIQPAVAVTERDRCEAAPLLEEMERPIVALHPGANDARRRWPVERFAEVARELVQSGFTVVATGSVGDRQLTAAVAQLGGPRVRDMGGQLSLGGMAALLSLTSLVIGNDTGPLHLARAVGARTLALYWVRNLFTYGPLSAARHQAIVAWDTRCPRCEVDWIQGECTHSESALLSIEADEVIDAARTMTTDGQG